MKELESKLLNCLRKSFRNTGFQMDSSKARFVKPTEFGAQWYALLIRISEDAGSVEVIPSIAVRFDEVEEIYHETSPYSSTEEHDTSTIECSIENYFSDTSNNFRITIAQEKDIEQACLFLYRLYEEVAKRVFAKYVTLKAVNILINGYPRLDLSLIHPHFRGSKGLIIDYLLGSKNLDNLNEVYTKSYRYLALGIYKGDYNKVADNLNAKRPAASV